MRLILRGGEEGLGTRLKGNDDYLMIKTKKQLLLRLVAYHCLNAVEIDLQKNSKKKRRKEKKTNIMICLCFV